MYLNVLGKASEALLWSSDMCAGSELTSAHWLESRVSLPVLRIIIGGVHIGIDPIM